MDPDRSEISKIRGVEEIQDICVTLTKAVVDGNVGIDETEIASLEEKKKEYKLALSFIRSPDKISKSKLKVIEQNGLKNISKTEAEIGIELTEALIITAKMINETDPISIRNNESQKSDYIDTCTEANRQCTDFFIKIHKKLSLSDEEVLSIYDTIFAKVGLDKELKAKALERFPGGVLAAVRAYLKISKELPGWNINVASFNEDKHHGTDLVSVSPDGKEKRLYSIKGSIHSQEVNISEITSQQQMEIVRKQISLETKEQDKGGQLDALYRIFLYAKKVMGSGVKTQAYFVKAPSATATLAI